MPCDSSYMEPSKREQDSLAVRGFLKECGLPVGKGDECYGDTKNLDRDVSNLCEFIKGRSQEWLSTRSLELQIFWRDHQKADRDREHASARARVKEHLRQKALKKLSPEERKVLGLK